ncbi:MAG: hypothetical protein IT547_05470 [Hyphomonadaceae bacterium]|nr:hypothetical protein [Hyphomonadaceae bacterium]
MSNDTNNPFSNVPALACAAIKDFLANAALKLPSGMEEAAVIYQTLDQVLGYLGQSAVDGGDRTITVSVRHIDANEAKINVNSVLHLPPLNDGNVRH